MVNRQQLMLMIRKDLTVHEPRNSLERPSERRRVSQEASVFGTIETAKLNTRAGGSGTLSSFDHDDAEAH